jgi:hypothetical protein
LAGTLDEWFGPEVTKSYWRTLLDRAERERKARARAKYQERRAKWVKVEAAKAERPKLKRQRTDARNNDQEIRAVLLAKRNEAGRVNLGLRKIAKQAGVSEASVRRARDS